ncbi:MAG: hypothetical protein ACRDFX_13675 [Chloroflexota bacterium]
MTLHSGFFTVVVIYAVLMALWGLLLFLRGSNPSGGYLGSLILAEGVTVVQGIIGLVLLITGHRPHDSLHYLYGVLAVLVIPSAYFLSAGGRERRDSLYFALAALFLVIIAVRASTTASS